ncbi:MAG: helix-turn-helix transcriptional regulator [Clostridiaceae bacterium]|jgi:DNA-binding transcriptional ArsR family regulator|nr:helix-turn-helix transcriptional regulator [Clostridiaceae bacterium]
MYTEEQKQIIEYAGLLKALAHPVRLCLVHKLSQKDHLTVSYFVSCMGASQSNISQHLGKLKDLGIVTFEKEGNFVKYILSNEKVRKIVKTIFEEK